MTDQPPYDWADDDDQWEDGQPPPPGWSDEGGVERDDSDSAPDDDNIGGGENYPTAGEEFIGGYPGELKDAWDYLMDIDKVDPANIRGLGFASIYEAVSWMESVGVLGFSAVVQSGGLYFPVIGDSDEAIETDEEQGDDGNEDNSDRLIDIFS